MTAGGSGWGDEAVRRPVPPPAMPGTAASPTPARPGSPGHGPPADGPGRRASGGGLGPGGPDAPGNPGRRRSGWRRVAAALAVLGLLVLLAPAPLVDPLVHRVVSGYGGDCAELDGIHVDSGSWPVVARALTGDLQDVSVDIDEVRFGSFAIRDVQMAIPSAGVAPLGTALVSPEADVSDGEASGTMPFGEIERIIGSYGVDVDLRPQDRPGGASSSHATDGSEGAQDMVADVEVPPFGPVPTGVTVSPAGGSLEIRLAPLDLVTLPPVHIDAAEPFRVDGVEVLDEGVRVDLTFDGVISAGEDRCEVGPGDAP